MRVVYFAVIQQKNDDVFKIEVASCNKEFVQEWIDSHENKLAMNQYYTLESCPLLNVR